MENLKFIIAKNIQQLRLENDMTQLDLGEKLNYSDKAVSKWERGESVPDIGVLKQMADMFSVSLDYLVESEHEHKPESKHSFSRRMHNHGFITGISILLVWLIATFVFVVCDIVIGGEPMHWMAFVYAMPASMIVWLVFNSVWFNRRRNFLIISLLMWTTLLSVYLTVLPFGFNPWQIFVLGVPGQIIIFMWSRIKPKDSKQ